MYFYFGRDLGKGEEGRLRTDDEVIMECDI